MMWDEVGMRRKGCVTKWGECVMKWGYAGEDACWEVWVAGTQERA